MRFDIVRRLYEGFKRLFLRVELAGFRVDNVLPPKAGNKTCGKTLVDMLEPRLLFSADHPMGLGVVSSEFLHHVWQVQEAQIASVTQDVLTHTASLSVESENVEVFTEDENIDDSLLVYHDDTSVGIIEVTTFDDVVDAVDMSSYESLYNDVGVDGRISLREAITVANNDETVGMIQLSEGEYTLVLGYGSGDENANAGGDLDILSEVHIQGAGNGTVIQQSLVGNRIFDIESNHFSLADLTIRGTFNAGGAVYVSESSNTRIDNVTFANHHSGGNGGAIYTLGEVNLNNVLFDFNSANQGGAAFVGEDGVLNVSNSTFINNTAVEDGGAVYSTGTLFINGSIFESNKTISTESSDASREAHFF